LSYIRIPHSSIENADIEVNGGDPGCGEIVKIYLRVNDAGGVEQIMSESTTTTCR
jgi:NifU-like protein involved in Fe-S cluster formation